MSALLVAKNVSKHFGGLKAVDSVNMTINEGDIFGIIGPNGAGKTTFFNICSGVYKPTHGEITFDGHELVGQKPEQIARLGMARTFQNIRLFKYMSVLENIFIGFQTKTKTGLTDAILHTATYKDDERLIREEGLKVLDSLGLLPFKDTKAGNLSYGMQRKVEIARALALGPKLLLLDEPAAGMNQQEKQELMRFVIDLNKKGYTIALIEHDMRFVMNSCNRILVLNFGQKICEGTPEEVREDKGVNEAYFGKGLLVGRKRATA